MAARSTSMRFLAATRPGLRGATLRTPFQRRGYQTAAETNVEPPKSKLQQLWNSPVGPKTVHFWAPIMKWGVILAGVADFARPAETLSLSQNMALLATGAIWTRWCFVIRPQNIFLATVNFFLFCVGFTQITRIFLYRQSVKNDPMKAEAEQAAKEEGQTAKSIVEDPVGAAKTAVGKN
ncbi:UPF0041 domain protein [Lineolata rhizophorae]|uniref:Mitochondrial pyruvate carrier n=1 Tax=Lineolata rhizophorae TaxID=578093 RepID=A0A6A6P2J3_9PEZI|nr:UPF0041 domain protein [Lineolata rhizophorae]